jgi:hypothetical protein
MIMGQSLRSPKHPFVDTTAPFAVITDFLWCRNFFVVSDIFVVTDFFLKQKFLLADNAHKSIFAASTDSFCGHHRVSDFLK